jgi:hypothetical protein
VIHRHAGVCDKDIIPRRAIVHGPDANLSAKRMGQLSIDAGGTRGGGLLLTEPVRSEIPAARKAGEHPRTSNTQRDIAGTALLSHDSGPTGCDLDLGEGLDVRCDTCGAASRLQAQLVIIELAFLLYPS